MLDNKTSEINWAYNAWVESMIKEGIATFQDLAVTSPEYEEGHLRWKYLFIEPGTKPPSGIKWTIYRCGG